MRVHVPFLCRRFGVCNVIGRKEARALISDFVRFRLRYCVVVCSLYVCV